MTDPQLVAKKLAAIETHVRELRTRADLDRIRRDVKEERFVAHTLQLAVQAALGLSLRDGALTKADTHIPYFASVIGHASASYAFAERRGLFQLVGTYEQARRVDRGEDAPEVGAYVDVDLHASYALDPTLGLVARLENVLGGSLERWDRYPQAPFILAFGVRMRW